MAKKLSTKKAVKKSGGGPYLVTALICETLLQDQKGTHSFVNVLDTFTVSGATDQMEPGTLRFIMAVNFKSGDFKGTKELRIVTESPIGERKTSLAAAMEFEGDEQGPAAFLNFNFSIKLPGLYWFDVLLDRKLTTRVPLRIRYEKEARPTEPNQDNFGEAERARGRRKKP